MSVEVVAVRWSCWSCDQTVITAPDGLPADWFECPAPPWRSQHPSSHHCPDHAEAARGLHRRQWARFEGRNLEVSAQEYELAKAAIRQATFLLDRLKFSAERAGDREV